MFYCFVVLCLAVFGNCYGKISGKVVGWLLIIEALICLIYPGYALIGNYGLLF